MKVKTNGGEPIPLGERRWMIASRTIAIDLGLGALAALAALLLKMVWPSVLGADPDALFLIPAAACAWRRGFRSGAAALFCGAFVVGDLFLKDGFSPIDLQALSVFLLEGGAIIALVAFSRRRLDDSERTAGQAQREFALLLDDVEEKYRLVVTNMPDVAWVTDASGMTKYIGENFEAVTGYTAAELYEHTPTVWFGNVHPDDLPLVKQAFEALIRDGSLFDLEYRYRRCNGEWIWLHDRACTTYDVNGVQYAFGLFGDVTARRKEQEELKQIERLLAEAEKVAHVGSWSREISSGEVTWSNETYRILGLAADQFDGTLGGMQRLVHPEDLETAVASERAVEGGDPIDVQLRFIHADGEQRIVCTHAELVTNPLGLPLRVVGTLKDITEQVEGEERERKLRLQLEEAQRLAELGRVAANIAHEVNNVLMAINPQAELADRAAPGNTHVRAATTRIRSAVTRGRRITEEILRFTHPHKPEVLRIDARQWLKGVIDEARTLVPPRIAIVCDLPSEPVFIQGDQAQLQQVILNLCSNASNAMIEGGVMTIALRNTGSPFVDLTVADTGVGIAKGILPRIFEPLFTGGPSQGSGLGLAVARQIVTQHGGAINAVSEPGRGSTFTVRLPRPNGRPEAERPPMETRSPERACRRLLLVEDDDAVSSGLAALLEMEGIDVHIAREGRGVPQAIRDFAPDAIVLDVTLPDISGTVVFETIRGEWPALPIIISTGQMCDPSIFALESQPHTEFLMKPYASAELMERIGRVVAG